MGVCVVLTAPFMWGKLLHFLSRSHPEFPFDTIRPTGFLSWQCTPVCQFIISSSPEQCSPRYSAPGHVPYLVSKGMTSGDIRF